MLTVTRTAVVSCAWVVMNASCSTYVQHRQYRRSSTENMTHCDKMRLSAHLVRGLLDHHEDFPEAGAEQKTALRVTPGRRRHGETAVLCCEGSLPTASAVRSAKLCTQLWSSHKSAARYAPMSACVGENDAKRMPRTLKSSGRARNALGTRSACLSWTP